MLRYGKNRDTLEQETRNALEEQLFDDLFIQGDEQEEPDDPMGFEDDQPQETRLQHLQRRFPDYPWAKPNYSECEGIPLGPEKATKLPYDVARDINWKSVQTYYKNLMWEREPTGKGVTSSNLPWIMN